MLLTDNMIGEGRYSDDDGTDYFFADFIDGAEDELPFVVAIPKVFAGYDPVDEDGVAHCYDLDRAEALDEFLAQLAGSYRFAVTAWREVCAPGWWADVTAISFSDKTDADLFTLRFGK